MIEELLRSKNLVLDPRLVQITKQWIRTGRSEFELSEELEILHVFERGGI